MALNQAGTITVVQERHNAQDKCVGSEQSEYCRS